MRDEDLRPQTIRSTLYYIWQDSKGLETSDICEELTICELLVKRAFVRARAHLPRLGMAYSNNQPVQVTLSCAHVI